MNTVDFLFSINIALVFYIFFQSYMQHKERKDLYSKLQQYREVDKEVIEEEKQIRKSFNAFKNRYMKKRGTIIEK